MDNRVGITIEADAASLSRGLATAQADIKRFASTSSQSFGVLKTTLAGIAATLAAGFTFSAITSGIRDAINEADDLRDLANRIGSTAEQIGGLKYAAQLSGVEVDKLAVSLVKMQKSLASAGTDQTLAAVFDSLGLSVKKLLELSPTEQFIQIGQAISKIENPAKANAAAMTLMGKSAAEVMQLFRDGAPALAEAVNDWNKLSGVTNAFTDNADAANDALAKLDLSMKGFNNTVASVVAVPLANWINQWSTGIANIREQIHALLADDLQANITKYENSFNSLMKTWQKQEEALKGGVMGQLKYGLFEGGLGISEYDVQQTKERVNTAEGMLQKLYDERDRLQKQTQSKPFIAPVLEGGGSNYSAPLKKHHEAMEKIKKTGTEITSVFEAWENAGGRFADAINPEMDKLKADSIEITSVWDELAKKDMEEVINPKMAENMAKTSDAAREFGMVMTSAVSSAITNWQGFGNLLKSIALDIAQLIIKLTILKPLEEAITSGVGSAIGSGVGSLFAEGGIMTTRGPLPLQAYAGGGVANRPQVALFGEGRMNEAYVPLPDGRRIPVVMSGGMGSSNTIQQTFHISGGIDAQMEQRLARAAEEGARRGYDLVHKDVQSNGPIRRQMR